MLKSSWYLLAVSWIVFCIPGAFGQNCVVTVSTVPANTTAICNGASVTLLATAPGASNFTWAPAAGLSSSIGFAVTATPSFTTTYTVTANGCVGSRTVVITVFHPVADFTYAPNNSPCSSTPIDFTSTSTPGGLTYKWKFNDPASAPGDTSADADPSFKFKAYGTGTSNFNVRLTVTDAHGCIASVTHPVIVTNSPDPGIADTNSVSPFAQCGGPQAFSLTINNSSTTQATNTSYTIDWGDGTASFSGGTIPGNISHDYDYYGYKNIVVTVTGTNGCKSVDTIPVFNGNGPVNLTPVYSPPSNCQCVPYTVTVPISNINSNTPGTKYTVTYGDGSAPETYIFPPPYTITHTFTKSSCNFISGSFNNTFEIQITSENSCGATQNTVTPFRVCTPPVAAYTITPAVIQCLASNSYTFTNVSTGESIVGSGVTTNCTPPTVVSWTFTPNTVSYTSGSSTSNIVTVHFTNAGTYDVRLITQTSCGLDTIIKQVCVANQPASSFTANPFSFCAPDTVKVINNSTAGGCNNESYSWTVSPSSGWFFVNGTNSTAFQPVFLFTVAGNYTITLTQNSACGSISSDRSITVMAVPDVTVAPVTSACLPVTINPSATVNPNNGIISIYAWTFNGGTPGNSGQLDPGAVSYNSTGTFKILFAVTNQCGTRTDSTIFTTSTTPVISINNDTTICDGSSVVLTASSPSNPTFFWLPFTGLSSIFGSPVTATPSTSVTYTVTATNANGCTADTTIAITVNPSPSLNIAGSPNPICFGDSVTINASGGSGVYTWNPSTGTSSTTGSTIKASPPITTVYHVQSTSASGCPGQASFTAIINPLPVMNFVPDPLTICSGSKDTIRVSGAALYSWNTPTGFVLINDSTVVAGPPDTTTFHVTGTTSLGCKDSLFSKVFVIPPPVLVLSNDTAICDKSKVILHAAGALNFTWAPNSSLNRVTGDTVTANPVIPTVYYVTGFAAQCSATDSILVTLLPLPTVNYSTTTQICIGASATLDVSGAQSYVWAPSATLSSGTDASVVASPTASITYTVTATGSNGCSDSVNVPVVVQPLPLVSFDKNPLDLCLYTTKRMGVHGAASYQWKPVNGFSQVAADSVAISVPSNTIYTVTGTSSFGCIDSITLPVNVNLNVDIAEPDTALCKGESVSLNLVNARFFLWAPAAGITTAGGPSATASPTITTTYTVTGTTANLCTTYDTIIITVNPLPVITVSPAGVNLCVNDSANLIASGAQNFYWSPATGLSSTIGGNVFVYPKDTVVYTVAGSNAFGCSASINIPINVIPAPHVEAGPDQALCISDPPIYLFGFDPVGGTWTGAGIINQLTGQFNPQLTGGGPTKVFYRIIDTYGCSNADSLVITVNSPVAPNAGSDTLSCTNSVPFQLTGFSPLGGTWSGMGVSPRGIFDPSTVAAGQYKLMYAVPGQCFTKDSIIITINVPPVVSIIASDSSICEGQSTNMSAIGGITYQWFPASSLDAGTGDKVVATPAATTTYTLSGIDGNNCSNVALLPIVIYPAPNVSVNPLAPVLCNGETVTLTGAGANTYSWNPAAGINQTTGTAVIASPSSTETYTVTGSSLQGCLGTASVIVEVNPIPSVLLLSSKQWMCNGDSVVFSAFGADAYTWSPGLTLSSSTGNAVTAYAPTSTTYTVTGTDANNCRDTDTVSISVYTPNLTVSQPKEICKRDTVTLTASGCSTYVWIPASNVVINNNNTVVVRPLTTTTFSVLGTDANTCTAAQTVIVTVHYPQITFDKDSLNICRGTPQTVTASGAGAYEWSPSVGLSSTTSSVVTVNPDSSTIYIVEGTDLYGCIDSVLFPADVFAVPAARFITETEPCDNLFVNFINQSSNSLQYTWSFGDGVTDNRDNPLHFYLSPGEYEVTLFAEGQGGCSNTMDTTIAIPDFDVYVPNAFSPNGDGINDIFKPVILKQLESYHLEVFSRWGERLYSTSGIEGGWDGRIEGKPAALSVYVWSIRYRSTSCSDERFIKGNVTLMK